MKNSVRCIISFALFCAFFLNNVSTAIACGPYTLSPYFSLTRHSDFPVIDFAAGRIGIVPETFDPMDLFVFYRQLNQAPLTKAEQKQVADAMENQIFYRASIFERLNPDGTLATPDFYERWADARAKIIGEKRDFETEKRYAGDYNYFPNCLPDSFRTATKTLESRVAKYGANDAVKEWVKGQDAVFANCGDASGLPENLSADFPEWLRQDRAYQIAAAQFYTGDMPSAREKFEEIADDENSVWRQTARFVAARTLIREASFIESASDEAAMAKAEKERRELYEQAAQKLQNILSDASMSEFHQSAHRLLGLVKYRTMPEERRRELAVKLAQNAENPNLYNDLTDYTYLLSNIFVDAETKGYAIDYEEAQKAGQDFGFNYVFKIRDVPPEQRSNELTDWIFTYKSADGFAHAFEKWKETGKTIWFVAAVIKAAPETPQISEILDEAEKIPGNSPAFATVRYHQIRLLIKSEKRGEARRKLDGIIGGEFKNLPLSSQNKFLAQRMSVAQNLDEFLKFAQRKAVIFDWDENDREEGMSLKNDQYLREWETRTMFDADAVAFFNEKMPLSVLRRAALSPQLPAHLKRFLVIAVWTRAFVLGNKEIEREFTPLMQRYAKEFAPYFSKYASANSAVNREVNGMLAVLRYPVIQPFIPVGFGREDSEPTTIDSNRGNWWCVPKESERKNAQYDVYPFYYPENYPKFLNQAEQQAAERELKQLVASGNSSTMLTRRAVEFANKNPNQQQVPELLHFAVRSTRYGCSDEETGKYSKQAFDILHKRYPKSAWTEDTPYWFN